MLSGYAAETLKMTIVIVIEGRFDLNCDVSLSYMIKINDLRIPVGFYPRIMHDETKVMVFGKPPLGSYYAC